MGFSLPFFLYTYHWQDIFYRIIHCMNHPEIIIRNKGELTKKLERMKASNTRVVADFDGTIIAHGVPTSWGLLGQISALGPEYHELREAYFKQYFPMEIDPTLTKAERDTFMEAWWRDHLALFSRFGIREEHFDEVDVHDVSLREGYREAFDYFHEQSIPVLILSAGISQTIEKVLQAQGMDRDHVSLTANRLLFDDDGNYAWVHPPRYIHIGNKDEQHASREVQSHFGERSNIILLWDNLDDIRMVPPHERNDTIAIGYCTSNKIAQMGRYAEVFDIVVPSDTSDHGVLKSITERMGSL